MRSSREWRPTPWTCPRSSRPLALVREPSTMNSISVLGLVLLGKVCQVAADPLDVPAFEQASGVGV